MKRITPPIAAPGPASIDSRPGRTVAFIWALGVAALLLITLVPVALAGPTSAVLSAPHASQTPAAASWRAHAVHPAVQPMSGGSSVTLYDHNGSLLLNATLQVANFSHTVNVNASGIVTDGGRPVGGANFSATWGDGSSISFTTNGGNNSTGTFQTAHLYTSTGVYSLVLAATNSTGTLVTVQMTISVPGTGGGGTGNRSTHWVYPLWAWSPNSTLRLNGTIWLNSTSGVGNLQVLGTISGGAPPYWSNATFGDGSSAGRSNLSGLLNLSYVYSSPGTYVLNVTAGDRNRTTVSVQTSLLVPGPTGGNGTAFQIALTAASAYLNGSWTTAFSLNSSGGFGLVSFNLSYGDGWATSGRYVAGNVALPSYHAYPPTARGGVYFATASATDSNNSTAWTSLAVYPTYAYVNGTGNGTNPCVPATRNGTPSVHLYGINGSLQLWLNLTFGATTTLFWMNVTGCVLGGVAPNMNLYDSFGNHSNGTMLIGNGDLGVATYGIGVMGNYTYTVTVVDGNGTTVRVSTLVHAWLLPGGNGSGPPPPPPYPVPVSVVVAADPVLGVAPLGVTVSAYIQGGAPPFNVVWSLPGATGSPHASGLSAVVVYPNPGWYPATAFVYNTSNAYGRVLVGYGSVWIDVVGSGSGNGTGNDSGNDSGNPHGHSPVPPQQASAGQPPSSGMTTLLLEILLVGAAVGAAVGYIFGGTRAQRPPVRWEGARLPADSEPRLER